MEVKIYIPKHALQAYVMNISTVRFTLPGEMLDVSTPYPPTPFQSIMFYCSDPVSMAKSNNSDFEKQPLSVLVGPQYSRVNIKVHRKLCAIRVDFLPGGMFRLLGIPMHELFDSSYDAVDFLGGELKQVNEQLQDVSTLEEGKNLIETFLLNQLSKAKEILPFDNAMRVLLENSGQMSIEKLAALSCLSLRQFERKSTERIGMSPKMYARIIKFSKAYRLHEAFPHLSWTSIAYRAGYYDQMHMIREFRAFVGVNPSVIEKQLHNTPLRMQKDLQF